MKKRWVIGVVVIFGVVGCARVSVVNVPTAAGDPALLLTGPVRSVRVADLIRTLPLGGENIVRREIASGPESSIVLVRIDDREQPHRHVKYDLTIVVVSGSGILWLDGTPLPMARGDIAHIPREVPHYFVSTGKTPAAAIAIFSPQFTGPDTQTTPP